MTEITSQLQEEHRHILKILDLIDHELGVVSDGSEANFVLLSDILSYIKCYHDDVHHPLEELVFESLLQHKKLWLVVEFLRGEHLKLAELTEQFRDAATQLKDSGSDEARHQFLCLGNAYIVTQRNHMAGEENSIFPQADTILTTDEWNDISQNVAVPSATDPVSGLSAKSKFHMLREQLEGRV